MDVLITPHLIDKFNIQQVQIIEIKRFRQIEQNSSKKKKIFISLNNKKAKTQEKGEIYTTPTFNPISKLHSEISLELRVNYA